MSRLEIRILEKKEYELWDGLVCSSIHGSPYNTSTYLDAFCSVTGGNFRIAGAFKGTEIFGGVALYEEGSRYGPIVSTRLLLYYNGLIVRELDTRYPSRQESHRVEVLSSLKEFLSKAGYARIQLRNRSSLRDMRVFGSNWTVRMSYTSVIPLLGIDACWARVDRSLRRLIDRSNDAGVEFSEDDDFESFYELHQRTHITKGAPLYLEYEEFKRYFRRLSACGIARLFHARMINGDVGASQLVLAGEHPVAHTVCAGSDREYATHGCSPFLRWKVCEQLYREGYEAIDLTDASLSSVSTFKSRLGADIHPCFLVSCTPSRTLRLRDVIHRLGGAWRSRLHVGRA